MMVDMEGTSEMTSTPPVFVRLTPSRFSGDVQIRADLVTSVVTDTSRPPGSIVWIGDDDAAYVKESPAEVVRAISTALPHYISIEFETCDSPLADDCACGSGLTCEDEPDAEDYALALNEAQEDAKIADERAEWYNGKAEQMRQRYESDIKRSDVLRAERDQLLAKLRETTAALDKANRELNAARYYTLGSGYGRDENGFIGYVTGNNPSAKAY